MDRFFLGGIAGDNAATGSTLPETNMAPENRPSQKETGFSNHPFSYAMLASGSVPFFFDRSPYILFLTYCIFSVSYAHFKQNSILKGDINMGTLLTQILKFMWLAYSPTFGLQWIYTIKCIDLIFHSHGAFNLTKAATCMMDCWCTHPPFDIRRLNCQHRSPMLHNCGNLDRF